LGAVVDFRFPHPNVTNSRLAKIQTEALPPFRRALTTWTLCTIPQVISALREMRRVLRQGWPSVVRGAWACAGPRGRMVAASPDTLLEMPRRWLSSQPQDQDLVTASGFHIDALDTGYMQGRNPFAFVYEGVARPVN
jgi:hypothetical protein